MGRSLVGQAPSFESRYIFEEEYQRECCPPNAMIQTLSYLDRRYGGPESYFLGGGLVYPTPTSQQPYKP